MKLHTIEYIKLEDFPIPAKKILRYYIKESHITPGSFVRWIVELNPKNGLGWLTIAEQEIVNDALIADGFDITCVVTIKV